MTYQEKVELLRSYKIAHLAVEGADRRMREFRERNAGVKAMVYTSTPMGVSTPRDLSDYAAALDELERKLWEAIHEFRLQEERVVCVVNAVADPTQRQLLTLRYLLFKPWAEVADGIGYCERQAFRIHRKAIEGLPV